MPVKLRHTHPHAPHAHKIVSILSGFKAPHIIHLLKFFLNSIHGFDLVWKEKQ